MRVVAAFALVILALAGSGSNAAASCGPPASVAENSARAMSVVYGTVTATGPGLLTVRVDRSLKGQESGTLRVFVGPARGAISSVDYPDMSGPVAVGSDHVLYLIRGSDGALETNACIGSHPGWPDAAELTFFGASVTSAAPSAPSPAPRTPVLSDPRVDDRLRVWAIPLVALLGAAAVIAIRRRRFGIPRL